MMSTLIFYFAILLFVGSIVLFIISARQKRKAGIPAGRIIYSDTSKWGKVEKPIYAHDLGLAGKPDYLIREGKTVIPVEVKSGKSPTAPYDSHIYQLAAYCLLVEEAYQVRPAYGLLHYANYTFEVEFTDELKNNLLETLQHMQNQTNHSQVNRSHEDARRCQHCGYRSICDQSLRI